MTPTLLLLSAALLAASADTGELIYRGQVVDAREPGGPLLYSYERRVQRDADGQSAAHITRSPEGTTLIVERAWVSPDHTLRRFEAANEQQHYSGTVEAAGGRLLFTLQRGGRVSMRSETVTAPVVSGPTLHGFIVHHWDALGAGERIAVRMIVLAQQATYGFEIRRVDADAARTTFTVTPSSAWVRLAVAPLTVTFDTAPRTPVRYAGRVPPMKQEDGRLRTLDARVDYTMEAASYR